MIKSLFEVLQRLSIASLRFINRVRIGRKKPYILTFPPYTNGKQLRVNGRVVEEINPYDFSKTRNPLIHFFQTLKVFITVKYPKTKVTVKAGDGSQTMITNHEGFFSGVVDVGADAFDRVLYETTVIKSKKQFRKDIFKCEANTRIIYISDIDDTILKSKATSFINLVFRTLFLPPGRRKTFPEAAKCYRKFKKGKDGTEDNLFFYISSSTWNIYPLLKSFLIINKFPLGPVLLQDVASEKLKQKEFSHGHKLDRIEEIIDFYPKLPLVLIGDAGQQDPLIYLEVAKRHPGRIKDILIRKSWWTKTTRNFSKIDQKAQQVGLKITYFENLESL